MKIPRFKDPISPVIRDREIGLGVMISYAKASGIRTFSVQNTLSCFRTGM
jgi:hypothetical protein